jgi:hypothetical protein
MSAGEVLLAIFGVLRKLLVALSIGYGAVFAVCLLRAFHGGMEIGASLPALLITEPFSSLIGMLYVHAFGGDVTNEYWDKLNMAGVLVVVAAGLINMMILWGLAQLFPKSNLETVPPPLNLARR